MLTALTMGFCFRRANSGLDCLPAPLTPLMTVAAGSPAAGRRAARVKEKNERTQ